MFEARGINGNVSFTVIIFFIYTFTVFFDHTSYIRYYNFLSLAVNNFDVCSTGILIICNVTIHSISVEANMYRLRELTYRMLYFTVPGG